MILKDMYDFLKRCSHIISDEDKNKLMTIQSHLEGTNNLKTTINKHGEHYDNCCWSNENETCGPDTCSCVQHRIRNTEIEKEATTLMKFYYNIYNISKCKNCNFQKI